MGDNILPATAGLSMRRHERQPLQQFSLVFEAIRIVLSGSDRGAVLAFVHSSAAMSGTTRASSPSQVFDRSGREGSSSRMRSAQFSGMSAAISR